jgi:hypothetical protein
VQEPEIELDATRANEFSGAPQ